MFQESWGKTQTSRKQTTKTVAVLHLTRRYPKNICNKQKQINKFHETSTSTEIFLGPFYYHYQIVHALIPGKLKVTFKSLNFLMHFPTGWFLNFRPPRMQINKTTRIDDIALGPLTRYKGHITPFIPVKSPQLPIYKAIYRGSFTPFITIVGTRILQKNNHVSVYNKSNMFTCIILITTRMTL